jgi:hypothetical protein
MKAAIKKAASGKALRVATVFTGAAVTAVGFGTVATAAQAAPVARQTPMLHTGGHIQSTNCSANQEPHWLHLAFSSANGGGLGVECYGFTGGVTDPAFGIANRAVYVCGGNNSGWYKNSISQTANYKEGNTYVHVPWYGYTLQYLYNNGWSHSDACPQSPPGL